MASWSDAYWTSRDGLELHYRDYAGPADRPPVLCLHGLTRNARDFEGLADRLAGEWRVIIPEFRGRGLSERDPISSRYIPPTYAADTLQLLDELGIAEAVFVGTSLGGIVTMIVAGFAPQRIAGAVLNDIGPALEKAGLDRIRSYVGNPVVFRDWDEAVDRLSAVHADAHPAYGREQWLGYAKRVAHETERGVEFDYDMAIAEPFNEMDDEAAAAVQAWPLFMGLNGKPVLILRGEHSDLFSLETAERMRDSLPGAELVTIPDVGHAPDLAEPRAVAAIDALLDRVLKR
jgi:pimeloyl-ACP methyl ester carboxylesterase